MLGHNGEGNTMQAFHIATQTLENYGAHAADGRWASGNAYWKMKGGTDYIITGVDRIQDAVAFVAALAMENGIGYKEFPTHWEAVSDDFLTEFEQSQMEYDGEIQFPAQRINVEEYMSSRRSAQ
jgi:hypothetical protein